MQTGQEQVWAWRDVYTPSRAATRSALNDAAVVITPFEGIRRYRSR